jgi:cytochrome bd ubiquinol oxidase subunit II
MPLLELVLAGVLLVALTFYALLGGADFGAGVWDLLAFGPRRQAQHALIVNAIGPIWEANHVWLIMVIVVLFNAFPPAFATISTALYIPLTIMLIGIVLRGAAFILRSYDAQTGDVQRWWGRLFASASIATPLMLGVCVGAISSGRIRVENGTVTTGYVAPWLALFPLSVGGFALVIFAFLAAVYLTVEADEPGLRDDFRLRALLAAVAVDAMALLVLMLSGDGAPRIRAGLIESPWAWPLQIVTSVVAVSAIWTLWARRFYLARAFAAAQVVLILWGWGAAQFPYLVTPDITIQNAAAPPITLRLLLTFLISGAIILFPSFYLLFRIFKGERAFAISGDATDAADGYAGAEAHGSSQKG